MNVYPPHQVNEFLTNDIEYSRISQLTNIKVKKRKELMKQKLKVLDQLMEKKSEIHKIDDELEDLRNLIQQRVNEVAELFQRDI